MRYLLFIFALLLLSAAPASAQTLAHPLARPGTMADRYGVIITGVSGDSDGAAILDTVVGSTGARWWYQYDNTVPDSPSAAIVQVHMLRPSRGLDSNLAQIQAQPQSNYWLLSNEPNDPGQDATSPADYATWLHTVTAAIKRTNPGAKTVGPNVLNWSESCTACPGFQTGKAWTDQMRSAYRTQYGAEPPFDIWAIHTYDLHWDTLPTVDWAYCARELTRFRAALDAVPALRHKPIWLSEFGVIWGYSSLRWDWTSAGWKGIPLGSFQRMPVSMYMIHFLAWLEANSTHLGIQRWFLYTTYGLPEPYTDTFTGISLFDRPPQPGAQLSNYGWIYRGAIKRAALRPS